MERAMSVEELDRLEASALRNGVFGAGAVRLCAEIRRLRYALDYIDAHDDASHAALALEGVATPPCCNGHGLEELRRDAT